MGTHFWLLSLWNLVEHVDCGREQLSGMRICSIITSFTTGGAETLVCNLSELFGKAGHNFAVIALSDAAQLGNCAETEQRMMARVQAAGGQALSLALGHRRGLFAGAWALRRALRDLRPDVVHAHTARAALMLSLIPRSAPLILTHHNSRLGFPRQLFKLFDRTVDTYVAISEECTSQRRRDVRRPVEQIINGADSRSRVAEPRLAPAAEPIILAVGTSSDQKDYPTLIRAVRPLIALLTPHDKKVRVRIVGGGAILPQLRQLVEEEGVGDVVELLGVRSDVPQLMRAADLFVNSSRYEGLSVAMIEAMMSALPIVATDVPGNRELVHPGTNGLLVPSGNPDRLAAAMASVLLDPAIYRAYSAAALARSRNLTIEACADAHLELYRRELSPPGSRPPPSRPTTPLDVAYRVSPTPPE